MTEVKTEMETSIDEVTTAVAAINATQAGIADLRKRFENVIFPVETPKGMKDAKAARQEIRQPRYTIENLRKDAKAPILALGRQLDAKAKELTAEVLAIEGPIDLQITGHEAKLEAERQEKIEAELQRVEAIQDRIADIRSAAEAVLGNNYPAERLAVFIADTEKFVIDDWFAEFKRQAQDAKDATLARLRERLAAALAREEEERKIAAERAELEKLRAEQAKREESERKEREAREAEERKKVEAAGKKRREEMAEQQRQIDAENARIAEDKIEQTRRQQISNQITVLKNLPTQGYGKTAAELARLLASAGGFTVPKLTKAERAELDEARTEAVRAIRSMFDGRKKYEVEAAALAEAKRQKEADEKAEAERKAKADALAKKARYPGDEAIVDALIVHFSVTDEIAQKWLAQYGKKKAEAA